MRKPLLLILSAVMTTQLWAAGKVLRVELRDGTSETYTLSEKPRVTFAGADAVITTAEASTSYERAEIKNFTFVSDTGTEGVDDIMTPTVNYTYLDGVFTAPGCNIAVYALSGTLVCSATDSADMRNLNPGIYIVKAGNRTIKIIKK